VIRKKTIIAAVFLSLSFTIVGMSASTGVVLASCNPQYPTNPGQSQDNPTTRPSSNVTDYHDAEYVRPDIVSGYYLGGVYAETVDYATPYVNQYTVGDITDTWVMEQNPSNYNMFVQVGFFNGYNGSGVDRTLFVEEDGLGGSGGNVTVLYPGTPPSQGSSYWLTITNSASGKYSLYVNNPNGSNIWGQAVDMGSSDASLMTQADLASETHSLASQMPGGYNDPVTFTSAKVYYNGQWLNFGPGQLQYNQTYFNAGIISPTEFAEGDTACLT